MNLSVVGSTYLEKCHFPEWNELYGSGLRSACLAKGLGATPILHTFVGREDEVGLRAKTQAEGVELGMVSLIPETISFSYMHGFSTPLIRPPQDIYGAWNPPNLEVEAASVLRFGFLEGTAVVSGERVVYDPQNPHAPEGYRANGSQANELAIVCNASEGRRLTNERDAEKIVATLAARESAAVIVLKCGSRGACVFSNRGVEWVPCFKTNSVWPIGSGDVFAAAFATFWAAGRADALEAARLASRCTAEYCETKNLRGIDVSALPERPEVTVRSFAKLVYLAGPFFSMAQIWQIGEARAALREQGFRVFSPLHDVGRGPAKFVYPKDIEGIEKADLVYAVVDGLDAGTLYEIGYAKALGKPVVAFVQNEKAEDLKMLDGSGCVIENDFVTSIYKTSWLSAE